MESYNNLIELRHAEQVALTEAVVPNQPIFGGSSNLGVHHVYEDGSTFPPRSPIMRSPSPTSDFSKSENEDSNFDDGADDDTNSIKSKDRENQDRTGPEGKTPNKEDLNSRLSFQRRSSYNDASDPTIRRESDLLLQMVPYRLRLPNQIRSDRLISGKQGSDSDIKSAAQEATNSVRLLLDKWTTSSSALVSSLLDEEAAGEKNEASVGGPRFVLERADIISLVTRPISVNIHTLNPIRTDGRHR